MMTTLSWLCSCIFSPDFSGEGKLSDEDAKTIRVSLLGLIKYYVFKEITFDELNQILCFVVTVKDENMVGSFLFLKLLTKAVCL